MAAPAPSFTEIAHVGQESVAAAVRMWADVARASVEAITSGPSELLDGRHAAELVFGFANQVLDAQRALLSALITMPNGTTPVADIATATAAVNGAIVKTARKTAPEAETAIETAARATTEIVEIAARAPAKIAETVAEGPYGAGSHAPLADRSEIPAGFPIKGNDGSKLYHVPGSSFYKRTNAEVWFATPEAAEAAGFQRPASQR